MDSFTLGHAKFQPNQSGIIYPSDMSTDEVVKQGVLLGKLKQKQKLEQYAWELFKLQVNYVTDHKEALEHNIPWCYGMAEEFIKYTEEKFNEA